MKRVYKRFRFISLHSVFYLLNKFGGKTILPKEMRRSVEKLRMKLLEKMGVSVGENVYVSANFFSSNYNNITLGRNGTVGMNCEFYAEGRISIGSDFLLGSNIVIHTSEHGMEFGGVPFIDQDSHIMSVIIGNNVYLGSNVIITPGVSIGDNIVVGAGSVVAKSLLEPGVYAGVPAKLVKTLCATNEER